MTRTASLTLVLIVVGCSSNARHSTSTGGASGANGGGPNGGTATAGGGGTGTGGSAGATGAGATGAGGTAGAAEPSACAEPSGTRTAPDWPALGVTPGADQIPVRVMNHCPFSLWIHAAGNGGVLTPDDAEIAAGGVQDYLAPAQWSAARVTAYKTGPRTGEIEKVEMTFSGADAGSVPTTALLNYNVTYVDWLGLPVEVEGVGGSGCGITACYQPVGTVLDRCPADLHQGDRCLSARSYCLDAANQAKPYCHALDDAIARCQTTYPEICPAGTTSDVYACTNGYGSEPLGCAVLNRGMLDVPLTRDGNGWRADGAAADPCNFYQTEPYNTYARWVHETCPRIYAFPYDDAVDQSGFHACQHGSVLRITWCPAG